MVLRRHSVTGGVIGMQNNHKRTNRFETLRGTKIYDLCAALPLIAWYAFCAWYVLPTVIEEVALLKLFIQTDPSVTPANVVLKTFAHLSTLLLLLLLVVMFAVRRVPQHSPIGFWPRFVAVAGTFIGVGIVLLPQQEVSSARYLASLVLIFSGSALAIYATLNLGRSVSVLPQARRLVTSGPYAVVRHPLYLGEIVATFGVALQFLLPWSMVLLGLHILFQLQRMKYEERVLSKAFPDYESYRARTTRLVPGLY